jgi:hypothetical protein
LRYSTGLTRFPRVEVIELLLLFFLDRNRKILRLIGEDIDVMDKIPIPLTGIPTVEEVTNEDALITDSQESNQGVWEGLLKNLRMKMIYWMMGSTIGSVECNSTKSTGSVKPNSRDSSTSGNPGD